jgi:hypothetical protein
LIGNGFLSFFPGRGSGFGATRRANGLPAAAQAKRAKQTFKTTVVLKASGQDLSGQGLS